MTVAKPSEGEIELVVSDEGRGFDPAEPKRGAAAIGFGLLSIRERVELLGGPDLSVDAAPGRGTCVTIVAPCRRQEPNNKGIQLATNARMSTQSGETFPAGSMP